MQTIRLDVRSYSSTGTAHTNLLIDGQDAGVLYLNQSELELLNKVLRAGCAEHEDVLFEQLEPDTEEFEYDVFED